jgi:hypothetical protein
MYIILELFHSRGAGWEETLMSGSVVEMEWIDKQPSTITPKEPDSVNNIEEEWKEYLIEVIVFASVDMLFRHLNPRGSHLDK